MKSILILLLIAFVRAELDTSGLDKRLNDLGLETPALDQDKIEQGQLALEEQCRKNGGEEAVERAKGAQMELKTCIESLINIEQMKVEIEQAKPTGDLDVVFKKYCAKTPQMLDCATTMTKNIDGCLAEDQKKVSTIVQDVAKTLLNFTCFKEGDRIALFISEGGPECLESKAEEIQNCMNATFGKYVEHLPGPDANITDLSSFNFPIFLFDERQCNEIEDVSKCVVKKLEGCKDPTPANVVESILKVIRRSIPCKKAEPSDPKVESAEYGKTSSASGLTLSALSLLCALLLAKV